MNDATPHPGFPDGSAVDMRPGGMQQHRARDTRSGAHPTSASAEEAGPPTSYGDTGPVYADAQGRAVLRVLSEGPEQITVKELANGRIHYFKQVPAASGVRYQAADGTFFWTKGRNAMLGRGEKTLRDDLTLRTR